MMLRFIASLCFPAVAGARGQLEGASNATQHCSSGALLLQVQQGRSKQSAGMEQESGFMTMWADRHDALVGGSCEYANAASGGSEAPSATSPYLSTKAYCAADASLYAAGAGCGSCWRIEYDGSPETNSGLGSSLVVQIVHSGSARTFRCQREAFQIITGATSGHVPVTYEPVDCDIGSGGAVATVLDGNNAWYTRVIFSNLPRGVVGAQVSIDSKTFAMTRSHGATWSANMDGSTGSASFSVSLEDGSTANLESCFTSWPVANGVSCSQSSSPLPSPSPMPLRTTTTTSTSLVASQPTSPSSPLPSPSPMPLRTTSTTSTSLVASQSTSPSSPLPSPSPMPLRTTTTTSTSLVASQSTSPSPRHTPTVPGTTFITGEIGGTKARLFEFVGQLTDQPHAGSKARAVHSSGGAAGGVVSEGQGYGLFLAGATLASLESNDDKWQQIADLTYEMFLGWRKMCELSAASGSCQDDEGFKCGNGSFPCLPHWKFKDDLTNIVGAGSAPDGDADALAGMLLAVMSVQGEASRPSWFEEMGRWAYATCVQFYESSTVASPSGSHRIVKLGACWGGWGDDGQNPSYHAPGVYRMCKHYMKSHDGLFGDNSLQGDSYESKWDTLIHTTYKILAAVQCPSTGLITNWAKVSEVGSQLTVSTGFSGSGTGGAEFGSEASRGIWRIALDYILFPSEARAAASAFLTPVSVQLEKKENAGSWSDSLDIDSSCLVNSIHSSWSWNMFMAGPTFAALVSPAGLPSERQQELINAAGKHVASFSIRDYYAGSWVAISTITLNGDLSKASAKTGFEEQPLTNESLATLDQ